MGSMNDSTHIELLELDAQNNIKVPEKGHTNDKTHIGELQPKEMGEGVDSFNCIRDERLPSDRRNGSSMYIDGTTSLRIIRSYAEKQKNTESKIRNERIVIATYKYN